MALNAALTQSGGSACTEVGMGKSGWGVGSRRGPKGLNFIKIENIIEKENKTLDQNHKNMPKIRKTKRKDKKLDRVIDIKENKAVFQWDALIVSATDATRCQHWRGCPQANKFEQVSGLDHHMSLRGVGPCSEIQCIMGNDHMEPPLPRRQKD